MQESRLNMKIFLIEAAGRRAYVRTLGFFPKLFTWDTTLIFIE